jgi:farnesyl-diphosphate farnesyltransferase
MSDMVNLQKKAEEVLKSTSRTFFIPISRLPSGLKEAVMSAYLCMRAMDEIEDHPTLPSSIKIELLRSICSVLQEEPFNESRIKAIFSPYSSQLEQVTLDLLDWIRLSPPSAVPDILKATSTMSAGMADWVAKEWRITSEQDLDQYTYFVAGLVGVMLSDLWRWYDGIETDRELAVAFGRGLQAVNIIRNRHEDKSRGVNFFPVGWELDDMFDYARRNLSYGDKYLRSIKPGPVHSFCHIPLSLAFGTLKAIGMGQAKLTRADVTAIVRRVTGS